VVDLLQTAADIVAALPDAVVVTGTDRRFSRRTRRADMLGWQVGDIVARRSPTTCHRASDPRRSREDRVLEGETQRTRHGSSITARVKSVTWRSRAGRSACRARSSYVATLRDITEPSAPGDAGTFEARTASGRIGVRRNRHLDANGRFTTVNTQRKTSPDTNARSWSAVVRPMLPTTTSRRRWVIQQALAGETGLFESQFTARWRSPHDPITYSTPQKDEEVLCLIRDVTDQKMLQEQLIQSKKCPIGQLVSGVAHELNNPLAGISAFAQLLLAEKRFPPDQRTARRRSTASAPRQPYRAEPADLCAPA